MYQKKGVYMLLQQIQDNIAKYKKESYKIYYKFVVIFIY